MILVILKPSMTNEYHLPSLHRTILHGHLLLIHHLHDPLQTEPGISTHFLRDEEKSRKTWILPCSLHFINWISMIFLLLVSDIHMSLCQSSVVSLQSFLLFKWHWPPGMDCGFEGILSQWTVLGSISYLKIKGRTCLIMSSFGN